MAFERCAPCWERHRERFVSAGFDGGMNRMHNSSRSHFEVSRVTGGRDTVELDTVMRRLRVTLTSSGSWLSCGESVLRQSLSEIRWVGKCMQLPLICVCQALIYIFLFFVLYDPDDVAKLSFFSTFSKKRAEEGEIKNNKSIAPHFNKRQNLYNMLDSNITIVHYFENTDFEDIIQPKKPRRLCAVQSLTRLAGYVASVLRQWLRPHRPGSIHDSFMHKEMKD